MNARLTLAGVSIMTYARLTVAGVSIMASAVLWPTPAQAHVSVCAVQADKPAPLSTTRTWYEGRVVCPWGAHNTGVVLQVELVKVRTFRDQTVSRTVIKRGRGAGHTTQDFGIWRCFEHNRGTYYTRTTAFPTGMQGPRPPKSKSSAKRALCWDVVPPRG